MLRSIGLLAALSAGLSGCAEEGQVESTTAEEVADSLALLGPDALENPPAGVDPEILESGRRAYVVCSVCHGLDGSGTPLGPSLRDATWIHIGGSAEEIAAVVRSGIDEPVEFPVPMPMMGGGDFDEDELTALSIYVDALSPS